MNHDSGSSGLPSTVHPLLFSLAATSNNSFAAPLNTQFNAQSLFSSLSHSTWAMYHTEPSVATTEEPETLSSASTRPSTRQLLIEETLVQHSAVTAMQQMALERLEDLLDSNIDDIVHKLGLDKPHPRPHASDMSDYEMDVPVGRKRRRASFNDTSDSAVPQELYQSALEQVRSLDPSMSASILHQFSKGKGVPSSLMALASSPQAMLSPASPQVSDGVTVVGKMRVVNSKFPAETRKVLEEWYKTHIERPYPSQQEKNELCARTGLSLTQINNWFGNKRMRYKGGSAKTSKTPKCVSGNHAKKPKAKKATFFTQELGFGVVGPFGGTSLGTSPNLQAFIGPLMASRGFSAPVPGSALSDLLGGFQTPSENSSDSAESPEIYPTLTGVVAEPAAT